MAHPFSCCSLRGGTSRFLPLVFFLCLVVACCVSLTTKGTEAQELPKVVARNAAAAAAASPLLPPTWGFNYDHFAPIEGGDGCQFTLADLLSLPHASEDAIAARLHTDFAAMQQLGATAVRLYVSLHSLLVNATSPNVTALSRLARVVDAANAHNLSVDLTGANVMRPSRVPSWLAAATDQDLRLAQTTFWRSVALQFVNATQEKKNKQTHPASAADAILAFNIINEPTVPTTDNAPLSVGCLGPANGTSPFGPQCDDSLCFCNALWRQPSLQFMAWAHATYKNASALSRHWPDFPRTAEGESWSHILLPASGSGGHHNASDPRYVDFVALQRQWAQDFCREMSTTIHDIDPARRVTVGDLGLSLGGQPTCTVGDGLDYYSVHLYPSHAGGAGDDNASAVKDWWRHVMGNVPDDGAPVVVEEMFPLGAPPDLASNLSLLLDLYLNATRPRAQGWVSFYWGSAQAMHMDPATAQLYSQWLQVWKAGCPFRSL